MKLSKIVRVFNGYQFTTHEFNQNNQNGYPIIKIKELKKGSILFTNDTCYVEEKPSLGRYIVVKGDCLIALTGNPLNKGGFDAIVGRASIYNNDSPGYINQRVCKVESKSNILLNKYLAYFLSLDNTTIQLASRFTGSANQANISFKDILDLDIDLPTLKIQQHIVNTIGSVDDLIENYQGRIKIICKILSVSLKQFREKMFIKYYDLQIIKSGIDKFDNTKIYIDTSKVDGINTISGGDLITYENKPSRANMTPIKNSVWFAKMKDSNKKIIVTSYDLDIVKNTIFSTGFLGISESTKLPISLLSAIIISNDFNIQRDLNSVGTTMAGINNETFLKILVPKLSENQIEGYDKKYKSFIYELSLLRQKINKLKQIKQQLLNKYF